MDTTDGLSIVFCFPKTKRETESDCVPEQAVSLESWLGPDCCKSQDVLRQIYFSTSGLPVWKVESCGHFPAWDSFSKTGWEHSGEAGSLDIILQEFSIWGSLPHAERGLLPSHWVNTRLFSLWGSLPLPPPLGLECEEGHVRGNLVRGQWERVAVNLFLEDTLRRERKEETREKSPGLQRTTVGIATRVHSNLSFSSSVAL